MGKMSVVLETDVMPMGLNVFQRRCVFLVASSQRQANKPGRRPIRALATFAVDCSRDEGEKFTCTC